MGLVEARIFFWIFFLSFGSGFCFGREVGMKGCVESWDLTEFLGQSLPYCIRTKISALLFFGSNHPHVLKVTQRDLCDLVSCVLFLFTSGLVRYRTALARLCASTPLVFGTLWTLTIYPYLKPRNLYTRSENIRQSAARWEAREFGYPQKGSAVAPP
jgi:hypothetical protein